MSIAAFSVHDILSGMYLGLLHKIENVCKHAKETVGSLSKENINLLNENNFTSKLSNFSSNLNEIHA